MASESKTPPPPSGNAKYVILGLLCLVAAGVLWALAGRDEPKEAEAPPPPAPEVERVNPMAEPMLELEPEEPDAAVDEPAEEPQPEKKKKPRARRGAWDCTGDLAGAAKVVNSYRSQIRTCYERRLKVNNILQGDLTLKVKVGPGGSVVATSVSGSLRDNEVFRCVRAIADTFKFAAPTGGNCAVVSVPFSFSPKTN